MVSSISNACLYVSSIQELRATRWNITTYAQFKANSSSGAEATRACIEHVSTFHKDLPIYLSVDPALLHLLREILKFETWCSSLYERSSANQTSQSFSQDLITAVLNADDRRRILGSGNLSTNNVNMKSVHSNGTQSFHYSQVDQSLMDFFAKTHPSHCSWRPPYNWYGSEQNRFRYNRYLSKYLPYRFTGFSEPSSSNVRYYGFKQLGQVLRNCAHHYRYKRWYMHLVNLGESGEMLVKSMTSDESTEDLDEVSDYVENAEEALFAGV